MACAQIGTEIYTRCTRYYLDQSTSNNIILVTESIAKGLYIKEESYETYISIIKEINEYIPKNSKLLVLSQEPWIYLTNDSEYCTYSAWMTNNKEFRLQRLNEYYEIHEDKKPEYIYTLKDDFTEDELEEKFSDYSISITENAYILKKE
jgi:hypothetical protein